MTMQAVKAVYVYAIPHGFTKCTMSWYQKIMLKAHDSVQEVSFGWQLENDAQGFFMILYFICILSTL